jgi:TM2 domain-containing membrane protein YozV
MKIIHSVSRDGVTSRVKDRLAAGLLALFAGWFGLHKFYTGRIGWGIVYLLLSWTALPLIVSFVEAVLYFIMTDDEFDARYN